MSRGTSSTIRESAGPFTPAERRHAQRVALIAWGLFGSGWMAMCGGAPWVTFVRQRLHVTTFEYFLLCSLPLLTVLAQIPGSLLVESRRSRRPLFLKAAAASRLIWLLIAALPWAIPASHPHLRFTALLGLLLLGSALSHLSTPAWFSWFAEMVPENVRGHYLGGRQALATVTQLLMWVVVPLIVDWNSSFTVFTVIFVVAAVLGVTDIACFLRVREPPMPPPREEERRALPALLAPAKDRRFRGYLLYALSESFMWGVAGPVFMLLALEYLKIDNFWSTFWVSTIPMVFTAVTLPMWGRVCDRFGYRPLLTFGTLASVVFPACWLLATPHLYWPFVLAAAVIGGTCTTAVSAADMSMMYDLTPRENRSTYIAYVMLASSLGAFLGPFLGGLAAGATEHVHLHLGGLALGNLHFLLIASFVVRLLHAAFVIPHLPEENPRPTRELARYLVDGPLSRVSSLTGRAKPAEGEEPAEEE